MTLAERFAYLKVVVPLLPTLLLATILHFLGLLPTSSKWDLRTTLWVAAIRSMTAPGRKPTSVSEQQAVSLRDSGPSGKLWAAKATIRVMSAEQDPVREVVFMAIRNLGDGTERYTKPFSENLTTEWVGYRDEGRKGEPLPARMSEKQRYTALMDEPSRTSNATTLYFHGGAYYLCGLGSHRQFLARLAKQSSGRVLAVEYRLAPRDAFPSQLIDALNAYLYLLYPPSDAFHEPVPANHVIFGGDSAGGNLAFALLQTLLELHRCKPAGLDNPVIRYHGRDVSVPLPAGVSVFSAWFDLTRSMPSVSRNADFDYLPPPTYSEMLSRFTHDHLWPTTPPRGDLFCDLTLLCHPLVSPVAAVDWSGSPPLWIYTGQEMLADEDALVAETARQTGAPVHYEQHEWMPHCAMLLLPEALNSKRGLISWGEFVGSCSEGKPVRTGGVLVQTSGKAEQIQGHFCSVTRAEALDLMIAAKDRRLNGWQPKMDVSPK